MPRRKEPRIPDAVLDQLLAGADPKTVFDPNGLLDDLKKALAERVLNAEMDHHLAGEEQGNRRNGYGKKTVITDTGQIELEVLRDRQARFDPQLIAKYQRRFPGFDDKIISMYARGMSTREIVGHLRDLYGIEDLARFDKRGHRRGVVGGRRLASPPAGSSSSANFL
jgi:putative transposase